MIPQISLNYWQIIVGYAMYQLTPYITDIIFLLLQFVGIRRYIISGDKDHFRKILKILELETRATSCKYTNGRDVPSGYFIGRHCVGQFINVNSYDDDKIHIVTTVSYYKRLTEESSISFNEGVKLADCGRIGLFAGQANLEDCGACNKDCVPGACTLGHTTARSRNRKNKKDCQKIENNISPTLYHEEVKIKKFWRQGAYKNFYYPSMKLDVTHINPIGDQGRVADDIIALYNKRGRAVTVFIHGVSMAGKSTIGYLVAKKLKGNFCHTFNPTDPGDHFQRMIGELNPHDEENVPIIIVLEEANEIIHAVHNKTVLRVAEIPTPVHNKGTWITFLDDLVFYKNVILILTSNESKADLDALDPAYLGPGRIDACYSMMNRLPIVRG
jgi:hypothetical protein